MYNDSQATNLQTVNLSEFRANLLKYLEIANKVGEISVTSNGKLLATIVPPLDQKSEAKKQLNALAPENLSLKAAEAINNADEHNALIISDISIWEVSMLIEKRRIEVNTTATNFLNLFLQSINISVQSISPEIAELSVSFDKELNNDPADKIIAATSIIYNSRLVTADQNLINSEILDTIW